MSRAGAHQTCVRCGRTLPHAAFRSDGRTRKLCPACFTLPRAGGNTRRPPAVVPVRLGQMVAARLVAQQLD